MFSAVVIQWVTSKDNAGTSLNSSIRAGNGNNSNGHHMRSATGPRDGGSPSRSFTPCLLDSSCTRPTTPADASAATTTQCCSHGVDYDAESCDSVSMTAAKMLAAEQKRPAVIVTTTIEHETTPMVKLPPPPLPQPPQQQPKVLVRHHRNSIVGADTVVAAVPTTGMGEATRGSRPVLPWGGHSNSRGRTWA